MSSPAQPRRTRQRTAVAAALAVARDFRTAQQIHDLLTEQGVPVALATVYRTLQSMADADEVDTIRTPDGTSAYRCCSHLRTHHHHLICRTCGHTVEVELSDFEGLMAAVAHRNGFTEVAHEIELYGLCERCSNPCNQA